MSYKIAATLIATSAVLGTAIAPAHGLGLNRVSASWDNADLWKAQYVNGNLVKTDYGTVTADNPENLVQFTSNGLDSQVRWGLAANSMNAQSGLGFTGLEDLSLEVGQVFNLGTLRHYNHTIYGSRGIVGQVDMALTLDFDDPELGAQEFDFSLNIDETWNRASMHDGGVCPYLTTGSGCSDAITWENNIGSQTFTTAGKQYSLELVGFANSFNTTDLVDTFVSQEQNISEAQLYARLVELDDEDPVDIPEPASLLGLALLGTYSVARRRQGNSSLTRKA